MWTEVAIVIGCFVVLRKMLSSPLPGRDGDVRCEDGQTARPFSSIPGPGGPALLRVIHEIITGGYAGRFHEFLVDRPALYGPIMKDNAFGADIVVLSGPDLIEEFVKKDEKYPSIWQFTPWINSRITLKEKMGLLTATGPEWKKLRSPWNHTMLKTSKVLAGVDNINEVTSDLVTNVMNKRNSRGLIQNLDKYLFRWSLECAGSFLFEKRLGLLSEEGNPEKEELINAVRDMFGTTESLMSTPLWLAKIIKRKDLQTHDRAWATILKQAREAVDARMEQLAREGEEGAEPEGFLSYVISTHQLSREETYSSAADIMAGAVDTTSNAAQFMLYELSCNPDVQDRLYDEICDVVGAGFPTADHIRKMELIKAVLKETLRLHPVVLGASRYLSEGVTVGGYYIPAGVSVNTNPVYNGQSEEYFPDAKSFKPERWLKENGGDKINNYACINFGIGIRGCIGRKTAETELQVLLIQVLQKYRLVYGGKSPIEHTSRTLLVPKETPAVSFLDRN